MSTFRYVGTRFGDAVAVDPVTKAELVLCANGALYSQTASGAPLSVLFSVYPPRPEYSK